MPELLPAVTEYELRARALSPLTAGAARAAPAARAAALFSACAASDGCHVSKSYTVRKRYRQARGSAGALTSKSTESGLE